MSDRKKFLYFLMNGDRKPLYKDAATGHILEGDAATLTKADGSPAHLDESPDQWNSFPIHYARNMKYWGVFRDMTPPMKFMKDGYSILKNQMWTEGMESLTWLAVAKLDPKRIPYIYVPFYLTEVNFAKYLEFKGYCQVEALEGGISKYFKAYESTQYTVNVDTDPDVQSVLLDGFFFDCKFFYDTFTDFDGSGTHLIPLVYENGEGTRIQIVANENAIVATAAPAGYESTSVNWILSASADTSLHFDGTLRLVPFTTHGQYTLRVRTDTGRTQDLYTQALNLPAYTISYSGDFDIKAGERLFIEATWTGASPIVYGESTVTISFKNRMNPTYANGIYPLTLVQRLVDQMTGGLYTVKSNWLQGKRDILFLSGDDIRGLSASSLDISLEQVFNALGFWQVGMGFDSDNNLIIEPLEYFFQDSVIADLGEVKGATVGLAEDIIVNSINAGYDEQSYDDVNGKFEFNQGQVWTLPITKIAKAWDLKVSPVRADPFGVEYIRIQTINKDTTDNAGDHTPFMLNVEPATQIADGRTFHKLYRPNFDLITGVPDPVNIFNALLSPKHGILNNGSLIRSILDFYLDSQLIKFASADKNSGLHTVLNGLDVLESESFQAGTLGKQLFRPYYFQFQTELPLNILDLINKSPYGKIKFTWNNKQWYGYLVDGIVNPGQNDMQTWKLLVAPGNDLSKFNA